MSDECRKIPKYVGCNYLPYYTYEAFKNTVEILNELDHHHRHEEDEDEDLHELEEKVDRMITQNALILSKLDALSTKLDNVEVKIDAIDGGNI